MISPIDRLAVALPVTGDLVAGIEPGSGAADAVPRLDGARPRGPPGARASPVRRRASPVARCRSRPGPARHRPGRRYRASGEAMLAAFRAEGALERPVRFPRGRCPAASPASSASSEALVHGWDLARATGLPLEFSADLVEESIAFSRVPVGTAFALRRTGRHSGRRSPCRPTTLSARPSRPALLGRPHRRTFEHFGRRQRRRAAAIPDSGDRRTPASRRTRRSRQLSKGGQGSAGHSPLGSGCRPCAAVRRPAAASSAPRAGSGARAAPPPGRRAARRRAVPAPRSPRPVSGLPAQRQSSVRSLGSTEKQMPWSTPYTCPSGIGMMWPPLRSALLTTASNTAIRRSAGVVAAHERRQVDVLVAVHPELDHARAERPLAQHRRRHDPPAGRLGHQVGGDLAAGQRAVGEVPQRPLPRHRLVDALAVEVAAADRADRVTLLASSMPALDVDLALAQQLQRLGVVRRSAQRPARRVARSWAGRRSAAVAVLPRADVPGRVERQRAQRARRPAGGHDPAGPGDERPGRHRGDRHAQRVGALVAVGEDGLLVDRLVGRRRRPPRRRPPRRRPRPGPWPRPGTPRRPARSAAPGRRRRRRAG